ncbi:response regulator transcription factor [Streptomyces sp. ST2-7A]|uniref:response regulator transcription factor n=1 Tax=Streptomyces sp. ST2-7A TaxID=2907214 RepID=UPI001F1708A7|nr:response regulator transcription factor [Streptomyces sp. ST2-7A]MCE7083338.1 response regulator transcription factor [Streptomyces sp. ST2-7A]
MVEDEAAASDSLVRELLRHGYEPVTVATGAEAMKMCGDVELVLLDLELPDVDGLEVCRRIRSDSQAAIIAFTDRSSELDRVLGLQAGSDDCMGKPYGFRELMARIDAVMRRVRPRPAAPGGEPEVLSHGPLTIDVARREIYVERELIEVTRKEFDLLHYLASHPGAVITRQRLMADLWGNPAAHPLGSRVTRTIDTHVSALRSKLGSSAWIQTVRGVGFRFGREAG